jgi:hypothetical protein
MAGSHRGLWKKAKPSLGQQSRLMLIVSGPRNLSFQGLLSSGGDMGQFSSDGKDRARVLAEILDGLPRVVDAILATPAETRMNVMDAVLESYRQTALKNLTVSEAEQLFDEIVGQLRAELHGRMKHPNPAA